MTFKQETISAIDPDRRVVTTDSGSYDADILVVALGADYDIAATPGLAEAGEFYSVPGAARLRDAVAAFDRGVAVIGICGPFFKCPPAPFEAALLLDTELRHRGVRDACDIRIVSPLPRPIPPSVPTSEAIVASLDERGITATFGDGISGIDPEAKVATLRSGGTLDYDLFFGIPRHVAPAVLESSGLLADGWIAVEPRHMRTSFDGVYAVGDCATAPVPRAGVFAEGQARAAFADIAAKLRGEGEAPPYDGRGICYLEFGDGLVGKVEADFLTGPSPVAPLVGPALEFAAEKERFGSSRRARWFS